MIGDPLLEIVHGSERFRSLIEAMQVECTGYRTLYRELRGESDGGA